MKKLIIAEELMLPLDAVVQKLAFIGRTGSGKTHLAGVMAEQMLEAGVQVIILDPVGVWYGLRMKADGSPGYPIPVFGGLKGDIPLEPTGGALVADLVVDRGISIILDVSQFESDADKARFAAAFADRFYFRKKASPSPVHLIVDEAQEFIPQNPNHGEERMLHAFVRICKLGRNFGIGASLISQRPQEVSKKALNQTELLFAFQMTGPQERKAIELWMSEKGIDTDVAGALPGLKVGTCFAWSPQWLGISQLIHGRPKTTINSSAAPIAGAKIQKRELAPIDLEQLSAKMKDTIERAKADDPKLLRAELARVKAELAKKPTPIQAIGEAIGKRLERPKTIEKPVFGAEDRQLVNRALHQMEKAIQIFAKAEGLLGTAILNVDKKLEKFAHPVLEVRPPGPVRYVLPPRAPRTAAPALPLGTSTGNDRGLTVSQRKILGYLVAFEIRGITPTREVIAAWLDIHHRNGSYGENLAFLRAEGYLEPESLILTELARKAATAPQTGFEGALAVITGSQARILELLRDGSRFTRESMAAAFNIHHRNGSFGENLARLRKMGLISSAGEIYILETVER